MANVKNELTHTAQASYALAFFLLFLGMGRLFNFALHDPLLGYANSYDMIRLQACHQIWPADKTVDITQGTPSAPLRRYALDKHVDTPCFPSSELLFTGTAISLAKLKNTVTGETLVSMKTVGLTKAIFLGITVLAFSLYCLQRNMASASLANALVMLVILSDPGITLYLNTFYTEFSAVYFLYVALAGCVILATSPAPWYWSLPLLIGLIGLGLSKPQHMPLTLLLSVLMAMWSWRQQLRSIAAIIVLCGVTPLLLQTSGQWVPRNDNTAVFDRANTLAAVLENTKDAKNIIDALELQNSCQQLQDAQWFVKEPDPAKLCPGIRTLETRSLYALFFWQPAATLAVTLKAIPAGKEWVFNGYGQVEGEQAQLASSRQQSLYALLQQITPAGFLVFFLAITAVTALYFIAGKQHRSTIMFAALLTLLCWSILGIAFLNSGFYDLSKHMHLYLPLLISNALILATLPLQHLAGTINTEYTGGRHA